MGNFNQHLIIGGILLTIMYFVLKHYNLLPVLTPIQIAFIIAITYVYCEMPDIDQPSSKIHRGASIVLGGVAIWAFMNHQNQIGIATILMLIFFHIVHHRTLVHSVFFGLLLSAPLLLVGNIYFIVAFIQYLGHITSEGELSIFSGNDLRVINFFGRQGRH